jgi:hypothetical protein
MSFAPSLTLPREGGGGNCAATLSLCFAEKRMLLIGNR